MKNFSLKFIPILKNKYFIAFMVFLLLILFIDKNAIIYQRKYYKKLEYLQQAKKFYLKELAKDKAAIEALKNPSNLEKFAREQYLMKRDDEDIFIFQYQNN